IGHNRIALIPKDVVLFGFGRIGRLVARLLVSQTGKGEQLRLRAIVLRNCSGGDLSKRADLLRYDSVHGPFAGTIVEDPDRTAIITNGQTVKRLEAPSPEEVDYVQYGISDALVIDKTVAFREHAGLSRQLQAKGVGDVLLTAPAKGGIPNIVTGINDGTYGGSGGNIFSAASCTT